MEADFGRYEDWTEADKKRITEGFQRQKKNSPFD